MQQEPIDGKPFSKPGDRVLLDAYYQEPVKQAEHFADLAKELFKLELVILGVYAAVLRLVDQQAINWKGVLIAFLLWATALVLTLRAIIPRKYTVLENVIRSLQLARGKEPLRGYLEKENRIKSSIFRGIDVGLFERFEGKRMIID
ncbi:MAG: hypothetical protein P9F75_11410 [Candidatus Contendobacter sp.]|nr:hypothetical protein [Candidatus Contendobacter sp.]